MRRKILHLILATMVAFGLWLYVITTVNPGYETTFYNIPVKLTNEAALEERGLMLDMKTNPTVTLKLSGNRSDLIRLDSSNIIIPVDLSRIHEAGEQLLSYTITYPGDVSEGSIDVLSKSPGAITVTTVATATKTVPIKPIFAGSVPEGYLTYPEDMTLSAETVKIHGPANEIEKITQAVFYVDLSDRTQSISGTFDLTLCNANGDAVAVDRVTANISEVDLNLRIQRYKEVTLVVTPIYGGGTNASNTVITIDPGIIAVSGSDKLLNAMGDTLNLGELDLKKILMEMLGDASEKELSESWTVELEIPLVDGLENLSNADKATVTVTFEDLMVKKLTVSKIETKNLASGLEATVITKNLNVYVCGKKSQVKDITGDDLTAAVDLTFVNDVMDDRMDADISFDAKKFPNVGVIETGKVLVRVTVELPPDPTEGTLQG